MRESCGTSRLFDQAANQLNTTFIHQPLIQAQLLNAIGRTYLGLGLYQKAIAVFERARNLRRNELGEDHVDTLTFTNNLPKAYLAGEQPEKWRAELEQAKPDAKK